MGCGGSKEAGPRTRRKSRTHEETELARVTGFPSNRNSGASASGQRANTEGHERPAESRTPTKRPRYSAEGVSVIDYATTTGRSRVFSEQDRPEEFQRRSAGAKERAVVGRARDAAKRLEERPPPRILDTIDAGGSESSSPVGSEVRRGRGVSGHEATAVRDGRQSGRRGSGRRR